MRQFHCVPKMFKLKSSISSEICCMRAVSGQKATAHLEENQIKAMKQSVEQ